MKKILISSQTQQLDVQTMVAQGISSYELMERAVHELYANMRTVCGKVDGKNFVVVSGTGNNGGDGLGVARLLIHDNADVKVWVCDFSEKMSAECRKNLDLVMAMDSEFVTMLSKTDFDELVIPEDTIIIDAMFGTGLSRSVTGKYADIINIINRSAGKVWSIDIPSGLFGEDNACNNGAIVNADATFAIGNMPLSSMFAENYVHYGEIKLVDIGHDEKSREAMSTEFNVIEEDDVVRHFRIRHPFDHKGTFGHAFMVTGSRGKAGAAIMASKACLRSGVGLLTLLSPEDICEIMQISVPEAMYETNFSGSFEKYNALGIGPGVGTGASACKYVDAVINSGKPFVADADALNIIAKNNSMLEMLSNCILTPHPKEFERLFGCFGSSVERLHFMSCFSREHNCAIILKGGVTAISLTNGSILFYIGMNPGVATGGSGDVLTGIITSLLAQGYTVDEAAVAGTWIHGEAGKLASAEFGMVSTLPTDVIAKLPLVTTRLYDHNRVLNFCN